MDENFIRDLSKVVQDLFNLTSRVDERLKILEEYTEKNDNLLKNEIEKVEEEVKRLSDKLNDQNPLHEIDKRLMLVEGASKSQENKWKVIIAYLIQGLFILIICYLLYLLNLTPPPIL